MQVESGHFCDIRQHLKQLPLHQFVRNQFCFTFARQNEKPGECEVQYCGKNNHIAGY